MMPAVSLWSGASVSRVCIFTAAQKRFILEYILPKQNLIRSVRPLSLQISTSKKPKNPQPTSWIFCYYLPFLKDAGRVSAVLFALCGGFFDHCCPGPVERTLPDYLGNPCCRLSASWPQIEISSLSGADGGYWGNIRALCFCNRRHKRFIKPYLIGQTVRTLPNQ